MVFALKKLSWWSAGRGNKHADANAQSRLPLHVEDRDLDAAIDDMLARYPVALAGLASAPADDHGGNAEDHGSDNEFGDEFARAFTASPRLSPQDGQHDDVQDTSSDKPESAKEVLHDRVI